MNVQLKENGKYTLITVSDFLATTTKREIIITHSVPNGKWVFKHKGERKKFYFPQDLRYTLVFGGHDLPVLVDTETSRFTGNALFNFVTDEPDKLKSFIVQHCLNPDPEKFHKIRVTPTDRSAVDGDGTPLFPETQAQEG